MRMRPVFSYLALVATACLVNWPGRLVSDSRDMLLQARGVSEFNNWHSPALTWLWGAFTPILGQPAGALLLQALLIFAYPAFVLLAPHGKELAGVHSAVYWGVRGLIVMALIAACGWIIKDETLLGLILCLLLALFWLASSRAKTPALVCALLAILILLVRPTNFVQLAVAASIAVVFVLRTSHARVASLAAIALGCGLALPATNFLNRSVLGATDAHPERSLIIFDVAGISTRIDRDLFADLPNWPTTEVQRPWNCYTSAKWDPFAWGNCREYADLVGDRLSGDAQGDVVRWWLSAIVQHPIAYIQHRLAHTHRLLFRSRSIVLTARAPEADNSANGQVDANGFQAWKPSVAYALFSFAALIVFSRPVLLLAVFGCVALLIDAWRQRRRSASPDVVAVAAAGMGLGNILMLMAFGVADEGRYLLPTLMCGLVGILRWFDLDARVPRAATKRRARMFASVPLRQLPRWKVSSD